MTILQGTRASNGTFKGPTMVLTSHDQVSKLTPGVVMVVPDTDPDWMPAFEYLAANGGAIITEVGGRLCHAAVVSREFGIPCVVGVTSACRVLHDKIVEVDGRAGIVKVVNAITA